MQNETDSRLKQDLSVDIVGQRSTSRSTPSRGGNRTIEDRTADEQRDVSDDDRLRMFQQQIFNDALPDLPPIPGYRTIWLTTSNSRDPIHRRMQLGYEPVTPDDVPGLDYATLKTGDHVGCIGINEMLAFKLPERLWEAYMNDAHHAAPLREEERIKEAVEQMQEQARESKAALISDEGFEELHRSSPLRGKFR